jgi:hypothetical protein
MINRLTLTNGETFLARYDESTGLYTWQISTSYGSGYEWTPVTTHKSAEGLSLKVVTDDHDRMIRVMNRLKGSTVALNRTPRIS